MTGGDPHFIAFDFLRLAQTDLRIAEFVLADQTLDSRMAGFHAQQAVEKTLKAAILLTRQREPGRTHDISALLSKLPPDWRVQRLDEPLSLLPRWVSGGRYPDDLVFSDAQTERDALDLAIEAISLLTADLQDAGFDLG